MPRHLVPPARTVTLGQRGDTWVVEHRPDRPATTAEGAVVPPILLLHGITGGAGINFSHLYPALARFHVIAPDQRAHGRGPRSERPTVADLADDAAALLAALEVDAAVVVGYSMGGAVAQHLTLEHPERVQGLALWATAARFSHGRWRRPLYRHAPVAARLLETASAQVGRVLGWDELARLDRNESAWVASEVARHDEDGLASLSRDLGRFDARTRLGEISVPTAVLVTGADRVVPVERQRELAAIDGATVVELRRAGHSSLMAQPDRVIPRAADAIARLAESCAG